MPDDRNVSWCEVREHTTYPYLLCGTIASLSPLMFGVQPPSLEVCGVLTYFTPDLLLAHISLCDKNVAKGQVILEKASFHNLEVAHQSWEGSWGLWYRSLSKEMRCAHVLHS